MKSTAIAFCGNPWLMICWTPTAWTEGEECDEQVIKLRALNAIRSVLKSGGATEIEMSEIESNIIYDIEVRSMTLPKST